MRGLTSPLWPIRYKPLPDELLSCWLVRLAHGHGLKVQTFCNLIFGNRNQVWNRDIDRLAPMWLVDELSRRTGTPLIDAWGTTLRTYEGVLYRQFRSVGTLHWVLPLKMYHRKRNGFGLQFCPVCLASDAVPYFRKEWRVAFVTVCRRHGNMLLDRCPVCGTAVAVHRLDMATSKAIEDLPLSYCFECGFDLRASSVEMPEKYDKAASTLLRALCQLPADEMPAKTEIGQLEVLRHLCTLMTSRYKHLCLREFVATQLGIPNPPVTPGKVSFEARPIAERHHLLQLSGWLVVDLERRLGEAWRCRAVRYNHLLKDFADRPDWYTKIVAQFANWRDRL